MIETEVRKACFGSNRSHLRSNTVEREILLWAGETDRTSFMDDIAPRRGIRYYLIVLEGPFHPFRVFGLKIKPAIGRFPLPATSELLYFQALKNFKNFKTTRSKLAKSGYAKTCNLLHGQADLNHMPPSGIKPKTPKNYPISSLKSEYNKNPTQPGLPPAYLRTNHIGPFTFHFTPMEFKLKLVLFLVSEPQFCKKFNLPYISFLKFCLKNMTIKQKSIPIGASRLMNYHDNAKYTH